MRSDLTDLARPHVATSETVAIAAKDVLPTESVLAWRG